MLFNDELFRPSFLYFVQRGRPLCPTFIFIQVFNETYLSSGYLDVVSKGNIILSIQMNCELSYRHELCLAAKTVRVLVPTMMTGNEKLTFPEGFLTCT